MDSTNDSTIREIENMRQMFGGGGSFGSPSLSGGASKLFLTLALVLMIVGGFNWFFTIFGQYYYDIRNGEAGGLVPDLPVLLGKIFRRKAKFVNKQLETDAKKLKRQVDITIGIQTTIYLLVGIAAIFGVFMLRDGSASGFVTKASLWILVIASFNWLLVVFGQFMFSTRSGGTTGIVPDAVVYASKLTGLQRLASNTDSTAPWPTTKRANPGSKTLEQGVVVTQTILYLLASLSAVGVTVGWSRGKIQL